jgi:hypothetical protein
MVASSARTLMSIEGGREHAEWIPCHEEANRYRGDSEACRAAEHGDEQTLGQELTDQTAVSGSKRGAYCRFLQACESTAEDECSHVHGTR